MTATNYCDRPEVTIDNYSYLFACDYLYSLVNGLEMSDEEREDGFAEEKGIVGDAQKWIEKQGSGYQCDRVTAAMILTEIARKAIR